MITWPQAQTQSQNLARDTTSATATFLNFWMNFYYKDIFAQLGKSITEKKKTASTVASQRSYQTPSDFFLLKRATVTVGSTIYPLEEVEDQEAWDYLTMQTITGVPARVFVRPRFGIGGTELQLDPVPGASTYTLGIVFEATDKDLSASSYTTGTVSLTANSASVTGSGTSWTTAMIGRYFLSGGSLTDGLWYRVANVLSTTSLTLENVYEGLTQSGGTYQIDEIFNLPEEMQVLPIYAALSEYFAIKKDTVQEGKYLGKYTVGLEKAGLRYATKSRSNVIKQYGNRFRGSYPRWFPASIS